MKQKNNNIQFRKKSLLGKLSKRFLIVLFLFSIVLQPIIMTYSKASAITTSDKFTIGQSVQSKYYFYTIESCLSSLSFQWKQYSDTKHYTPTQLKNFEWFPDNLPSDIAAVSIMEPIITDAATITDGKITCSEASNQLLKKAFAFWGLSSDEVYKNLVCRENGLYSGIFGRSPNDKDVNCSEGTDVFSFNYAGTTREDNVEPTNKLATTVFREYIIKKIYNGDGTKLPGAAPLLTAEETYWLNREIVVDFCSGGAVSFTKPADTTKSPEIRWINDQDGTETTVWLNKSKSDWWSNTWGKEKDILLWQDPENISPYEYPYAGSKKSATTCSSAIISMNGSADAYKTSVMPKDTTGSTISDLVKPTATEKTETTETKCAISGVGWIICPVVNFLAGVVDGSWNILEGFLETKSDIVNNDSVTYKVWQVVRNLANVVFVIVFLIIIFSQITSFGISNYGIKKLLPKLIISAILVNISFFVCQLAVDLSNILGVSIKDTISNVVSSIELSDPGKLTSWNTEGKGFIGIAGKALAFTGTAGLAWASIGTLIPVLLSGLVALIMILFLLIGRQALIVLLVILSPLAFVAFLLPNTEKLFDKWKKTFTSLLLLFPIVALVVGASDLASKVLTGAFLSADATDGQWLGQIAAAAVAILPLFVVPGMLKKSLDGVGNIGGMINKLGDKAGGSLGKWGTNRYNNSAVARGRETRKAAKAQFKARRYAEKMQKDGIVGALYRGSATGYTGLGLTAQQRAQKDAVISSARAAVEAAENKELGEQTQVLNKEIAAVRSGNNSLYKNQDGSSDTDGYLLDRARGQTRYYDSATSSIKVKKDSSITNVQRQAASDALVTLGRADQVRSLRDNETIINGVGESANEKTLRQQMVQKSISKGASSISAKAPDLVKNSADAAFGNVSAGDIYKYTKATATEHMNYLNSLQKAHEAATNETARLISSGASTTEIDAAREIEKKAMNKYNSASGSFVNAIETIAKTPAYRAEYSGETGKVIAENALFDSTNSASYNATLHTDIRRGLNKIKAGNNYIPS